MVYGKYMYMVNIHKIKYAMTLQFLVLVLLAYGFSYLLFLYCRYIFYLCIQGNFMAVKGKEKSIGPKRKAHQKDVRPTHAL